MLRTLQGTRRAMTVAFVAMATMVAALLTVGAAAPATAASTVTAGPSTATPTVALGSNVTIDFATSGTAYAKDWIAFYSSGAIQSTCPSPATHWNYTSSGTQSAGSKAVASGSLTFNTAGWSLGTYSVYLCQNDGYTSIGTPIKVSVTTLTTASTSVPQGSTLTFGFGAPAAQQSATDWIGLYSAGTTPGNQGSAYWGYVNSGTQTAGAAAVASGTLAFSTAGWPMGTYTAYFLYADGYTQIGSPLTITVVPPTADVLDVDFASGAPVDHAQKLTPTTSGSPSIAADATIGKKAATFNGSSDAYQYDFTSQYAKLANHFTVECQFRWNGAAIPTGTSAWPSECSGLQNGGMGLIVYNGKLDFELNVGGYKDIYAPIQPGVWYDAVGTWNGSTASIYLDGKLVSSAAASGTLTVPTTTTKGFSLGADLSGSGGVEQFAPVSIATARVFTSAMAADAVAAQYRITVPNNAVTVTRSGQGTASASVASALAGATVTLTQSAATGYTFTGWKVTSPTDGSVTVAADGTFTMPNVPVAVQAVFAPHTYTVHFDGNGADAGTATDQALTYDTTALLSANPFTRAGFHLAGWATTPDGAPVYSDRARTVNLTAADKATVTLYAVWHGDQPAGAAVPAPDVLNVDFSDGTPKDNAQNLAVTTVGHPAIAPDAALGRDVAAFNGTTDAYLYDFTGSFPKLAHGLTEECQFRWDGDTFPTGTSTWPSICNAEQSGGGGIMYYNGALQAELYVGGTYVDAIDPNPIVRGRWYDAIQTWDGSTLSLYVDGALVASAKATGALGLPQTTNGATPLGLGADITGGGGTESYAPISLGGARIWSSALTAAQVATQAQGTSPHDVTITRSGQGTATATPSSAWVNDEVALAQKAATGYTFGGWGVTQPAGVKVGSDSAITMPDADVAVTAGFTPDAYTVVFDGNGADGGAMDPQALSYDTPATLAASTFTRAGYYFGGWSTTPGALPTYGDAASVVNLTADRGATVTLSAFWVPNGQFIVRAGSTGHGTVTSSGLTAAPGDTVTLTQKADTGYHFTGWQVVAPADGSVTVAKDGSFTMPEEPVNAEGAFAPDAYTVRFDGGAADGTMPDQALVYGQPAALDANVFSRDGYVLSGWATTDGGDVAYADGATVSNLADSDGAAVTLHAVWKQLVTAPGSWPSLPAGFVTDTFHLPASATSEAISQPLLGLWNGAAPTGFTKVSGDDWLSVSSTGVVTGTAPADAPDWAGEITVSATNGTTTSQILVEAPVAAAPEVQTASWNAWADGAAVTDAVGKNLQAIASRGLGILSFQDGGAAMAQQIGAALGWHVATSGDLGIVSASPFTNASRVGVTAAAPAFAATIDAHGQKVRVWDAALDESATDTAARAAQAAAIAAELQPDVFTAMTTPVVLLGDLGSADLAPVLTATGVADTYREANPDATADPGATWPVFPAAATTASRVDYVLEAGTGLRLADADLLSVGRPSGTAPAANSWASDHAAVVATFTVGDGSAAPTAPVVTTGKSTVAYQVDHGPASGAAFLTAVGAHADADGSTLVADLSAVDFGAAGWYTAKVYASKGGVVSDPVTVAVRVAPAPQVTLGHDTATFADGDPIDATAVLGQLAPAFVGDGTGTETVDLSGVSGVGSHPVVVTATDEWGFTATAAATVVITAATPYAITYQLNGGTATGSNPTSYTVLSAPITLSSPTRAGYAFDGWTGPGYSVPSTMVTIPTGTRGDLAFVAHWSPVAYAISYDLAGGAATRPNPTTYTIESAPITLVNPTRYAYTFAGWTGTGLASATKTVTIATGSLGDRTYTATWTPAAPVWSAGTVYANPDTIVFFNGRLFENAWYTKGETPGSNPNGAWEEIGAPTASVQGTYPAWTPSWIYEGGETVVYNGKVWVAPWYTRDSTPGSAGSPWQEKGAPVTTARGTFAAWTSTWVYNGGETVAYNGHLWKAKWYTKGSAPAAGNAAWQDLGVY